MFHNILKTKLILVRVDIFKFCFACGTSGLQAFDLE